jgi:isopentenyldiphosphate isomerase
MRVLPSALGFVVVYLGVPKTSTFLLQSPSRSVTVSNAFFNRINRRSMSTSLNDNKINEYRAAAAEEIVEIVDESNNVLTPCKRSEMRANRLIHRATYAFVKDSANYFYVQKRSTLKDYCPSFFDPTPGGVVAAGESYEDTNRREVEEEMGIPANTPMSHLFTFFYEDTRLRCWGDAWELVWDGPLSLQQTEVSEVVKMSMQEILERADAGESFTPDSIAAARKYVDEKGGLDNEAFLIDRSKPIVEPVVTFHQN